MITISTRNVNHALPTAIGMLEELGVRRSSRNGDVTMFPSPVTTVYHRPTERVLFDADRDANPFFHFFEALWMLAGRKDVGYVARFAASIKQFSDDGKTFNGGYGFRWREHFGQDQLDIIVKRLKNDAQDRRCVIQMWDGHLDLDLPSKDVPCNTAAYVSINQDGALDLTVTNRSNDMIWGCYGANAVHFSMLQEYLAGRIGVPVGFYWQMSNNLHKYDFNSRAAADILANYTADGVEEPYSSGLVRPYPMFDAGLDPKTWDQDLEMFMENPACFGFQQSFFRRVAVPMWHAWLSYKELDGAERFKAAKDNLSQCRATDWAGACLDWINRREQTAIKKGLAA